MAHAYLHACTKEGERERPAVRGKMKTDITAQMSYLNARKVHTNVEDLIFQTLLQPGEISYRLT